MSLFDQIREFLRFVLMPKVSESQIEKMNTVLEEMMTFRFKLTKIVQGVIENEDVGDEVENEDSSEDSDNEVKIESKYKPGLLPKEHFISHFSEDITNLAPLPLLNTDLFESVHSPYKTIRMKKRSSVNVLHTLITNQERLSVYNLTNGIIPLALEKDIEKVSNHKLVKKFLNSVKVEGGIIYQCKKLIVFGTSYKKGHVVILPGSKNDVPLFGKIIQLLACENYAYFLYKNVLATYCIKTDLFFIEELETDGFVPAHQLCDPRPLGNSYFYPNTRGEKQIFTSRYYPWLF